MKHIEIVDVSPRDGLQNERALVSTQDKLRLIERAIAAGARRIEATSFVNPSRVPQMADAEAVMAAVPRENGVSYIGLALNERGFQRAARAGCDEVTFVVVASETFSRRNQGVGIEDMMAAWRSVARPAKEAGLKVTGLVAAAFGCPFEGAVPEARVLDLARRLLQEEPDEIGFADTIGCGVPGQVHSMVSAARDFAGDVSLRCHFHDTRNTGAANAWAAYQAGATALDASFGGFGGCPFAPRATGNVATEDLVYLFETSGVHTGIALEEAIANGIWLGDILGKPAPSALGRAGPFRSAA